VSNSEILSEFSTKPGSMRPSETLAARNPTAIGTALALLSRNPHWHFFPIAPGTKDRPMVKDNLASGATNNPTVIRSWSVECNVGLALAKSEVIAVDVDRKPGKNGEQTFYDLEFRHGDAEHYAFPLTFKVLTPSKGWHLYYRGEHKFALGKHGFGEGIDSPNYVLLPGSVLANGGNYTVIANAPIAEAPAWFAEYLKYKETVETEQIPAVDLDHPDNIAWAIHYLEYDAPPSIQFKSGEKTLLDIAGVLKDHGISEGTAVELVAEHYNKRCEPPWNLGEGPIADRLDVKVHNAFAYLRQTQPGAHTPQADFSVDQPSEVEIAALAALAAWWKRFDHEWRIRRSVTSIDGKMFSVVRTPAPRRKPKGKVSCASQPKK
jgi:hypothetical protein